MTAAPEKPKEHIAYGCKFEFAMPKIGVELRLFGLAPELQKNPHTTYTGEGRLFHAQQACYLLWPKEFEMQEWSEDCLDLFCSYREPAVTGPKSASKTTTAAIYALLFWLRDPLNTAVLICAPSGKTLRRGIWKEVKRAFAKVQPIYPEANLADYKTAIQAEKNDDAHGIFGIQVAQGQTERALSRLIGFHPKNLLIIVDEATDTPEAIDEACANLDKVAGEFQIIRLGNAKSRFDCHGKACEPKAGWKSITVEDDFWETEHGACLHLDGLKSPNIKLGKRKYPYLLDERDVEKAAKRYGGESSPKFWRFIRGFWAPDGNENTVMTETMCVMFDVRASCSSDPKTEWRGLPALYAALDPAFGGDMCNLTFAKIGTCRDGRARIEFGDEIALELVADSKTPMDHQIAHMARDKCKARGIPAHRFGTDSTGTGRGVAAILKREWSSRVQEVSFNSRGSERPVSNDNPKPCREEYTNFVTELWFSVRRFVECDQVRGLSEAAMKEFCIRQWEEMAGGRYEIESKPKMKERTHGASPDRSDTVAILCEVARRNGVQIDELGAIAERGEDRKVEEADMRAQAAAMDFDADEGCYMDASL